MAQDTSAEDDELDEELDEEDEEEELTVEERLAYLEEQNEGLKRVGGLLLVLCFLIGGLLVYSQMQLRGAIYSEALILSSKNVPRATLTTTPSGHLGLLFYDAMGILASDPQFSAVPNLDGVVLYDRSGKPRIVLGVNDKDEAVFDLLDAQGKLTFSQGHISPPSASSSGTTPAGNQATSASDKAVKGGGKTPVPDGLATP